MQTRLQLFLLFALNELDRITKLRFNLRLPRFGIGFRRAKAKKKKSIKEHTKFMRNLNKNLLETEIVAAFNDSQAALHYTDVCLLKVSMSKLWNGYDA